MRRRTVYLILASSALVWSLGFLTAPMFASSIRPEGAVYAFYGRVCHQLPDRSVTWFGGPWAVCHRCSAIYLSFAAVLLFFPVVRSLDSWKPPGPAVIVGLLLPMALDGLLDFVGILDATTSSRVITGMLAGVCLGLTVPPLFLEAVQQLTKR
ncbi:MAG TPA: hypothetical protein DCX46_13095 [Bacteroidetes bacterium]|nr:hypothetical protein [Bacteroidota bacterium]